MTSKKQPHTFRSDIKAIFDKVGKQLKKEHAAFKKSIRTYGKKPDSRIAEFVILFLVVGILFSLFALLDGWLQTFTKAAEDNNAVIEVSVEKTDEDCALGEAEYDISAKLVDSDSGYVEIKAYEIAFDLTNYSLAADAVDFEIGADEDDVSNYDDGIIRAYIKEEEATLTGEIEGLELASLNLQKEDYSGSSEAACHMKYINDNKYTDYTDFLNELKSVHFQKETEANNTIYEQYQKILTDRIISGIIREVLQDVALLPTIQDILSGNGDVLDIGNVDVLDIIESLSIDEADFNDKMYGLYLMSQIVLGLPEDTVVSSAIEVMNDQDYDDNTVVTILKDKQDEDDETITHDNIKMALTEVFITGDVDELTDFVAALLEAIAESEDSDDLDELAEIYSDEHKEIYQIDIDTEKSRIYAFEENSSGEQKIIVFPVGEQGEYTGDEDEDDGNNNGAGDSDSGSRGTPASGRTSGNGGSGTGSSGGSGSSETGGSGTSSGGGGSGSQDGSSGSGSEPSSEDEGNGEESSEPQRGTGDGYECKERPEKGADPAGVCGCVGEDCGFGDNDENRYDWRCCHRAWGACQNDGKRACVTVFGEGGTHQCEVGKVEECVPQSQVDEVQDRKDSLFCEGEPPNIAQPADGAGKPSCFLRDGDNWVTCANNDKCKEVGEKTGANWCYGGYCGRP